MPRTKTSRLETTKVEVERLFSIALKNGTIMEAYKVQNGGADHFKTMQILKEHGLEPIPYQKALSAIDENQEVKNKLWGHWFFLANEGLGRDYAAGKQPLSPDAYTGDYVAYGEDSGRFDFIVGLGSRVASVVIGIKIKDASTNVALGVLADAKKGRRQ